MNTTNKSLFNLIEIFRKGKQNIPVLDTVKHCEEKNIHDYYCDSKRTHVTQQL